MRTWLVELRGTITRDVKHMEADAESEAEVREACATEFPSYRVHSITPRLASGCSDGTTPATPAAGPRKRRRS